MNEVKCNKEVQLKKADFLKTNNYLELEKLIEPNKLEAYLEKENVVLVEGSKESGKTKVLMQLVKLALNNKKHMVFISVGSKTIKAELIVRFKDNDIDVSNQNLITLYISDKQYEFVIELIKNTPKGHIIIIDDFSNLEIEHLKQLEKLKELAKEYELTVWCSANFEESNNESITYSEYIDYSLIIGD
jgi:Archaeal ATPase.